jgi:TolB-like protein/DNA-binding winged helix-turn-helix (wHTH) protein
MQLEQGFRLGDCEVYPADGTLITPTGPQRLGPRPMELLLFLASEPYRVFSRDEIMAGVWGRRVVSDETLSRSISDLRRAFAENPAAPRYIETLSRRGYRLRVRPEPVVVAAHTTSPDSGPAPNRSSRTVARRFALAIIAGVIALGSWWHFSRTDPNGGNDGLAGDAAPPAVQLAENGVAVLPFANLSDDPSMEYFSSGLGEELLNALAAQDSLEVVARTSTLAFRDTERDIREIGRLLGVAHIIEGSVRREGERVRVTVQLIDARNGFHRFSKTYDRPLAAVLDLQETLALEVGAALAPRLAAGGEWDPVRRPTSSAEAYEAFLLGKHLQRRVTPESLELSAGHLRRAIALDPGFAAAHAALAETLALTSQYAEQPIAALRDEIQVHIDLALAIDPANVQAWHARGLLEFYQRRFRDAAASFGTARSHGENSGTAAMHARALRFLGEFRAGLDITTEALRTDPLNAHLINNHATLLSVLGQHDEAERWLERALEIEPSHLNSYWALGLNRWNAGQRRSAVDWYREGIERGIRQSRAYAELGWILLELGELEASREWIDRALASAADPVEHFDVAAAWHVAARDVSGLQAMAVDFSARFPGRPHLALVRALAALSADDAATAVAEYEALLAVAPLRLDGRWDMDRGYWHRLLLAHARRELGQHDAAELDLGRAEPWLDAYERDGGSPARVAYYRAVIASLRGDAAGALAGLDAAQRAGWRLDHAPHHELLFARFRDDARFAELTAALRDDAPGDPENGLP